MIPVLIRYLSGYVKIQIRGYSPERFLNLCCYHQIRFWGLNSVENAYELFLSLADFYKIRPYVRKTHTKVILKKRYGFPFFLSRYRKRKLFFTSIILCICLIWFDSQFVWDIHFQGNKRWTDPVLTEFLKKEGTSCGMRKKNVDCQGIVKALRKEYNDIVWVSASMDGSRLKIQIKENEDELSLFTSNQEKSTEEADSEKPVDLVASTDGVITKLVTRAGVPQVHIGDSVTKGTILVSGRIEILNDSGEVTGYRYERADADIYADTQLDYQEELSLIRKEKSYTGRKRMACFFRIGSFQWDSWIGKKSGRNQEKIRMEHPVTWGENFILPISYGWESVRNYRFTDQKYTQKEIQEILSSHFQRFCKDLEEKGIQICENNVKIYMYAKKATASGTLYLNQQIKEEADTEIITMERKEPDESVGTDD